MSFELRLKKLMHIYNVTNKHLANELNVDPSLISRWKNGHRIPSEKYDQIRDIASFFIGLNQTIEQQTTSIFDLATGTSWWTWARATTTRSTLSSTTSRR